MVTLQQIKEFVAGCKAIADTYHAQHYPNNPPPSFEIKERKRYWQVIDTHSGGRAAHCFIDKESGDVLKPASWSVPAKHARGNLYDAAKGLGSMGPYGPAYLR